METRIYCETEKDSLNAKVNFTFYVIKRTLYYSGTNITNYEGEPNFNPASYLPDWWEGGRVFPPALSYVTYARVYTFKPATLTVPYDVLSEWTLATFDSTTYVYSLYRWEVNSKDTESIDVSFSKTEVRGYLLVTGDLAGLLNLKTIGLAIKTEIAGFNRIIKSFTFGVNYVLDDPKIFGRSLPAKEGIIYPNLFNIIGFGTRSVNANYYTVEVICGDKEQCPKGTCACEHDNVTCCIDPHTGKVVKEIANE